MLLTKLAYLEYKGLKQAYFLKKGRNASASQFFMTKYRFTKYRIPLLRIHCFLFFRLSSFLFLSFAFFPSYSFLWVHCFASSSFLFIAFLHLLLPPPFAPIASRQRRRQNRRRSAARSAIRGRKFCAQRRPSTAEASAMAAT